MNYEFFEGLNRLAPGSVVIDRKTGSVTVKDWNLEEFVNTHCDKCCPKKIEGNTETLGGSPANGENTFPKAIFLINGRFKRVINPLSNAHGNTAKCNCTCRICRIGGEHTSTGEEKYESTQSNQYFAPSIKGKLGKWILHARKFLFTSISRF